MSYLGCNLHFCLNQKNGYYCFLMKYLAEYFLRYVSYLAV
jgi:hypothetical protein